MQDVYAQFEWPTAVVKATLTGSNDADIDKCQEKMYKCLKRSVDSLKLTNSHGIFQNWDQYTINSFYKYCKDKCVLPQINQTKDEIDLIGPINCVRDVQQKLNFLSQLVKERASRIPTTQRPSSAVSRSARADITSTTGHAKVYNIMISYSERDIKYCQRLIDRLAEEGFSIWAEPAFLDRQRDVASQMNKSDCIILCVSENYYENQSCEKEARYAFQIGKYVFPVKIQNDPLICWQREVFKDKLFFQLFGSENHFDFGYGNLLLRILQYTQPGFVSLLQQRTVRLQQDNDESYGLMTVERRRTLYDNKIRSLMNGGRVEQEEMKHLTEQLHTILNAARNDYIEAIDINKRDDDALSKEFGWIQRWLRKSTNVTKNNLPPFAPSGDINDAPFPMPDYIAKSLNLYDSSVSSKKSPIKLRHAFECDIFKRPTEQPFTRTLFNIIPANNELTYGKCTQLLVPFSTSLQTSISDVFDNDIIPQKAATLPVIPLEYISSNTVGTQKYRKTTNLNDAPKRPMKIGKKRIGKKHPRPTRELLNVYLQSFAKRMNENALEFEKFCLINA
ncbi:hypothetical protein I4U23_015440 [Adineta vaga]|nr:hypothetical protein I4U23_015440 [Adineta vaga]